MNAPSHVCTSLNETLEDTYKNWSQPRLQITVYL
jgi:hypothetical protein